MKIRRFVLPLLMTACTVKYSQYKTPSGATHYNIICGNEFERCESKANELCPNGFERFGSLESVRDIICGNEFERCESKANELCPNGFERFGSMKRSTHDAPRLLVRTQTEYELDIECDDRPR
jgi:hypothetical protein